MVSAVVKGPAGDVIQIICKLNISFVIIIYVTRLKDAIKIRPYFSTATQMIKRAIKFGIVAPEMIAIRWMHNLICSMLTKIATTEICIGEW